MAMDPVGMQQLVNALNAAREALGAGLHARAPQAAPVQKADFAQLLKASLDRVDASQSKANTLMQQFQLGDPKVSLEETMVAMQKANLEFQEIVQIRNRVVSAYHDIMNMQV
jgi:flagellar hook-basal body complex protein FliE